MHYLTTLPVLALSLISPASAACGDSLPAGLTPGGPSVALNITSNARTRDYRLFIPKNYDTSTPAGLILSYHGRGKDPANQEQISQLSQERFNTDYVVAYPAGLKHAWQGASYAEAGVNDTLFTSDLISHLESLLCIDSTRVFATGKSNGGGFVGLMTCDPELSVRIKAFAPVSGAFYGQIPGTSAYDDACKPTRKDVPIIDFHGGKDTTIPYEGGSGNGGSLPAIPAWLQDKAHRAGCTSPDPTASRSLKDGRVIEDSWACGGDADKPVIVGYYEKDMAHRWPGSEQNGTTLVQATPRILDFFKQWS